MISFKNVSYTIKKKTILSNITFNIKESEKVLIIGKSGSGKTTIFNLLSLNILPTKGNIFVKNQNITLYNQKKKANFLAHTVRLIFQEDDLYPDLTVNNNLLLYFYQKDIDFYLKKANLLALKNKKVKYLSGGERQRISIIKNCMSEFSILLCDEITSALDDNNAKRFINFILNLFPNKTIIFISHNPLLFDNYIDHYIYVENQKISEKIINDITCIKKNNHSIKCKSNVSIFIKNGLKKLNFFMLLIYILSVFCFSIYFNYERIFNSFAMSSFYSYFDYNLYEIKNYQGIPNDSNILLDLSDSLTNCKVFLNDICFLSIPLKPFYKEDETIFYVSSSLIDSFNIDTIQEITLSNKNIYLKSKEIKFINEEGMFASSCIYYNYNIIKNNLKNIEKKNYLYYSETLIKENEYFTNNPLFTNNDSALPYLESNALLDYLTYEMVFSSIKKIIEYFVLIIFFYSIITSIILVISTIIKSLKQIAILLARGINIYQILFSHLIPVFIYFFIALIIAILININYFYIGIILTTFILIIANIIGIIYIKNQSINNLLKEDFLC